MGSSVSPWVGDEFVAGGVHGAAAAAGRGAGHGAPPGHAMGRAVGPARWCSPRHMAPLKSRAEG